MKKETLKATPQRLQSLDALRGFDMLFIAGGGGIIKGIALITGFTWLGSQVEHVAWDGFVFYDMIFPLFLFIAGISFPFSLDKHRQKGESDKKFYHHIFKRAAILILLGLVINGLLKLDFATQRYASVLGRIGLAWMFGAIIFMNTQKVAIRVLWVIGILIGYWFILAFFQAPDANTLVISEALQNRVPADVLNATGNYSIKGSIVGYVDRLLLPGRKHLEIHDPEGILSTLPAIATALLGMLTGWFIKNKNNKITDTKKALYLALAGVGLLIIAYTWNLVCPINKNLWTSSFVCCAGGWSLLLFAAFYYIIDVLKYKRWSFFFIVIGLNSITIYVAQSLISFGYTSKAAFGGIINLFCETWQPLFSSIAYVAVVWGFLYFLYKKNVFLKV